MCLTKQAFDILRTELGSPRSPPLELIANEDQVKKMTIEDGMRFWQDGTGTPGRKPQDFPLIQKNQLAHTHLWVVRNDDVAYAIERCAFGEKLESRVIKHTNLTGGEPAYSGGEVLFLDQSTIVVNGCSGRYGPRTKAEMELTARAFSKSGYGVWSMGFDEETNRPMRFIGAFPEWVE